MLGRFVLKKQLSFIIVEGGKKKKTVRGDSYEGLTTKRNVINYTYIRGWAPFMSWNNAQLTRDNGDSIINRLPIMARGTR